MSHSVRGVAHGHRRVRGDAAEATAEADLACQHGDDAKAFKAFTGRGRAGARVRLAAELDRIHAAMAELAQATRRVPGRAFYLALHRRAASGQACLRWRSVRGNRHLPWAGMPDLFAAQLPGLASWYARVQERVEALNHAECVVRGELRHLRRAASTGGLPAA